MKKFKKFMYKYISGGASIKIGKEKYLNYPKTANFMVPGMMMAGFCQSGALDIKSLFITGLALVGIGAFSYFYPVFNPLKFDELDDEGKEFYVANYGMDNLSKEQRDEYLKNKK